MKLAAVILENFRGYCQPTRVEIDEDLTAFIGKSDAGKSTILEALEIFFNDGKPEHGDACVHVSATDSRLMGELVLVCKQPGKHAYKQATVERVDIPNRLNREFTVEAPNQVWCGDITYVWAQGQWYYLAVVLVLDLFARRAVCWAFSLRPDADLVVQALEMAFEQRGRPQGLLFHSDQGSQGGFNRSSQHQIVE